MALSYKTSNSWDNITLMCIHDHKEPIPMQLMEGQSLFYACPKYDVNNLEEGEHKCNNRISLQDFTKFLEMINDKIASADDDFEVLNLTNFEWTSTKGIYFKVLKDDNGHLTVGMINKRAIRR